MTDTNFSRELFVVLEQQLKMILSLRVEVTALKNVLQKHDATFQAQFRAEAERAKEKVDPESALVQKKFYEARLRLKG